MSSLSDAVKVYNEAEKIWEKLSKQPEKGIIVKTGRETGEFVDKKGKKLPTIGKTIWNKSKQEFATELQTEYVTWTDENPDKDWTDFVDEKKASFKIGTGQTVADDVSIHESELQDQTEWWRRQATHKTKDGVYYVVPLVFEKPFQRSFFKSHIDSKTEKLIISDGIMKDESLMNDFKKMAFQKLALDLSKAVTDENKNNDSIKYAIVPVNTTTKKVVGGNNNEEEIQLAQSWYMEARRKQYQRLWIKILFEVDWIDQLPNKTDPAIDFNETTREVMIPVKDFRNHLDILKQVLYHLDVQMKQGGNTGEPYPSIDTPFDATCYATKVDKIFENINKFLIDNKKPNLSDWTATADAPNAALQFGFTESLKLQYVAYADMPDCLCDEGNINAYTLKKGLQALRITQPMNNVTMNGLLYYLPEIVGRYKKYFTGGDSKPSLFRSEQSYIDFIQKYIITPDGQVPIIQLSQGNDPSDVSQYLSVIHEMMANPIWSKLAGGDYLKDPMSLLSPEIKDSVLAASNVSNLHAGDDALLEALEAELLDMAALYDKLLNRIPIVDMVKMAGIMIFKCLADDDLKRKLCKLALENLPIAQVRVTLYPCLMDMGDEGEMAMIALEEKISGRKGMLYEAAKERFPDKFDAMGTPDDGAMSEMTKLYCADPAFAAKLGRSPDDFNEEFNSWIEEEANDAICDCVLMLYGSVMETVENVQDMAEGIIDALNSEKSKSKSIEQQATIALDRIFQPFYNGIGDFMETLFKAFVNSMVEMVKQMLLAAVLIVLKYAKSELLGSLMKDLCGGDGFSGDSFGDFIMKQKLYEDQGANKLFDVLGNLDMKFLKGAFGGEIQALWDSISKLNEGFSPSELERLFSPQCASDSSGEYLAKQLQTELVSDEVLEYCNKFPGISIDEVMAASEALATTGTPFPWTPVPSDWQPSPDDFNKLGPVPSAGDVADFAQALGRTFDPAKMQKYKNDYEQAKEILCDLCTPGTGANEKLQELITEKDLNEVMHNEQEQMWDDFKSFMPLIDPQRIQENIPPMFCGPCNPRQRGMKPLMAKQTHDTQEYMQEKINKEAFKTIDDVFNNALAVYKSVLKGKGEQKHQWDQKLREKIKDLEIVLEDSNPSAGTYTPAEAAEERLNAMIETAQAEEPAPGEAGVALSLQNSIAAAITDKKSDQLVYVDWDSGYVEYAYEISAEPSKANNQSPTSPYKLYTCFNYGDEDRPMSEYGSLVNIPKKTVKIVVINTVSNSVDYEWPPSDNNSFDSHELDNFDMNFTPIQLLAGYFLGNPAAPEAFWKSVLIGGVSAGGANWMRGNLPIGASHIFETVLYRSMAYDLFKENNFNNLPLTNEDAKKFCIGDVPAVPLLDKEKVLEDIRKTRDELECVVSFFAKPDAVSISNLYGLYKMMIKVCVVEEYLKNIFAFAIIRLSDVLEAEGYMSLLLNNIKSLVDETLGDNGFERLLEYSGLIINGRYQLGELDEDVELPALKSEIECLKILIKETAIEISDIFDARVKNLVNSEWESQMVAFKDVTDAEFGDDLWARFLQYAIAPEYMSPAEHSMPIPHSKDMDNSFVKNMDKNGVFGDTLMKPVMALPTFLGGLGAPGDNPLPQMQVGENFVTTNGGLFFEPYLRIKSVFEDIPLTEGFDLSTNKNSYSEGGLFKLKNILEQCWLLKKDRHAFKEQYAKYLGMSLENENKTALGGFSGQKPSDKSTPFYPDGLVDDLDDDEKENMHDTIDKIFGQITEELGEYSPSTSPTLKRLFRMFFCPIGPMSDHFSESENQGFGVEGQFKTAPLAQYSGKSLHFLVSSYCNPFELQSEANLERDCFVVNYNSPDELDPWWLNCHYYWQNPKYGGYQDPKDPSSYNFNFTNRGLTDVNLMGSTESTSETSLISSIYWAKSKRVTQYPPKVEIDAPDLGEAWSLEAGATEDILIFIRKWLIELNDKNIAKVVGAQSSKSFRYEAIFWSYFRDMCLDAPFDMWFDFSLGMRLNLVTPYTSENESEAQDLTMLAASLNYWGVGNDESLNLSTQQQQEYINDKAFSISVTKDALGVTRHWNCIPLDSVEWSLADFWQSFDTVVAAHNGSSKDAFKYQSYLKKSNPWGDKIFWKNGKPQLTILRGEEYDGQLPQIPSFVPKKAAWQNHADITEYQTAFWHEEESQTLIKNFQEDYQVVGADMFNRRPTLHAVATLLANNFISHSGDDTPHHKSNKDRKNEILESMKFELLAKLMAKKGYYNDYSKEQPNTLINELLPVKEAVLNAVFMYRYFMQASYPILDELMAPTKNVINVFLAQSYAAINGNYQFEDPSLNVDEDDKMNQHHPVEIAERFMMLILQMGANMVDPTWKTPWYLPGPITPVGVLAKILSQPEEKDKEEETENLLDGDAEECADVPSEPEPEAE